MWEITLIGDCRDVVFLVSLKRELAKNFSDIYIDLRCREKCLFNIKFKKALYEDISHYILGTILRIVKRKYFVSNLNIWSRNKIVNSFFLGGIINLDILDEITYAKAKTRLGKCVYIDSFVMFKLPRLIEMWQRLCDYINIRLKDSSQKDKYLELLKFLCSNLEGETEAILIDKLNDSYVLLDKYLNVIKDIPTSNDTDLILSLVIYSPKKLIINCKDSLSEKTNRIITYIFDTKVSKVIFC